MSHALDHSPMSLTQGAARMTPPPPTQLRTNETPPETPPETPSRPLKDAPKKPSENVRNVRLAIWGVIVVLSLSATLHFGTPGWIEEQRTRQIEILVGHDGDSLRVMCAARPPTEKQFGWMHICETVAGVDREVRK